MPSTTVRRRRSMTRCARFPASRSFADRDRAARIRRRKAFRCAASARAARRSRGFVDVNATARHSSFDATVARGGVFVRASHFNESRNNGTPLTTNDTAMTQLAAGADVGALTLRAYGLDQDYAQTFSSIAADRKSERLTVDQRVPSRGRGGSAQFAHAIGAHNAIVTGAEGRDV